MESFSGHGTAGRTADQNGDKVRFKQENKPKSCATHSHLHATVSSAESEPEVVHFPEANCTVTTNADSDDMDSDLEPEVYFEDDALHPSPGQNGDSHSQENSKPTASQNPGGKKAQKSSRFTGYNLYCHEKAKEGVTGFFSKEWAKSWAQLSAAERQSYSKRAAQTRRVNVHNTLKQILTLLHTLEGAADGITFAVVGCHQEKFFLDGFGPAYDALAVQIGDLRQSMSKKSHDQEVEEDCSARKQAIDSCTRLRDILQKRLNKLAEDVLGYKHFPYKRAERGEVIVEGVPKDLLPLKPPALLNVVEMRRLLAATIYISASAEHLTGAEDTDSSEPAADDSSHSRASGITDSQTDRKNSVTRTDCLHAELESDGHIVSSMDTVGSSSSNHLLGFHHVATDSSGQDTVLCEGHCAALRHSGSSARQKKETAEDAASDGYTFIRPKPKTWRLAPVKTRNKLPKTPKERQRKEYVRHIWTIPEKEILQRHFLETIQRGRFPSKKEIQDVIVAEPLLHRRTWKKIDNFLRSQHG